MKKALLAALCALPLIAAAPARAQDDGILRGGSTVPNFLGSTGLLLAPSANTVGANGFSAYGYTSDDLDAFGALVGISDRLEVGIGFLDSDPANESGLNITAKFSLLRETTVTPGLAVGVVDAVDTLDLDPGVYVVASKDLSTFPSFGTLPISLHVGWGSGFYDEKIFVGGEFRLGTPLDILPTRPTFSVLADWVREDFNVGLRGRYRGFAVTVALFDLDDFGGGISYTGSLNLR